VKQKRGGGKTVRGKVRLFLCTLNMLALFLLFPMLVDWPQGPAPTISDRQAAAFFISGVRCGEKHAVDQGMPLIPERPECILNESSHIKAESDVKADANGHPLRGGVYIRAVYQAFRLEEKAG
jgi:hypothetical protein